MKRFGPHFGAYVLGAVIIGALLNRTCAPPDPTCDPDPLYGGCPSSCEFGSLGTWAGRSFGIYILLEFGSNIAMSELKKVSNMKQKMLDDNDFKMAAVGALHELLQEEKSRKKK